MNKLLALLAGAGLLALTTGCPPATTKTTGTTAGGTHMKSTSPMGSTDIKIEKKADEKKMDEKKVEEKAPEPKVETKVEKIEKKEEKKEDKK